MKPRGFTLVELMIALLLSSIVLTGVVWNLAAVARRQQDIDDLSRLQERAALALGVLEIELQMAGYGGLRPLRDLPATSRGLPAAQDPCAWFDRWPPEPVRLDDTLAPATCDAHEGGRVPGTGVLRVVRAAGRDDAPAPGRLGIVTGTPASEQPFLVTGSPPAHVAFEAGLREYRAIVASLYYIANRSDGDPRLPALRVKELTAIAGRPGVRDTEVVDGIDGLSLESGWQDSADGPLVFGRPDARPPAATLRALRLAISLVSERGQRLQASRTVALRNPAPESA